MVTENVELEVGEVIPPENIEEVIEISPEEKMEQDRARRQGWRPLEEFNGDKSKWVDAKAFNERAEHELPIMRERYRKLDTRLESTEKKLTETEKRLEDATTVLLEVRELSKKAEERGYAKALNELRERELKAFREQDEMEFARIRAEREALEQNRPVKVEQAPPPPPPVVAPPPAAPQINPEVQAWIASEEWYRTSPSMQAYANEMDGDIEREFGHWPMRDKLAEVKRRVMAKFPERFGMAPPPPPSPAAHTRASAVSTSIAAPAPRTKKRTVNDLPPDAKAALAKIKKQIPEYKDEEYLRLYFSDEQ